MNEVTTKKSTVWSTGLAMFSMFFGAGNIVFPLALGQTAQDKNFYAVLGMIITAVFVPLSGLFGMLLFGGDYTAFFRRIGKMPGYLIILLILGLIGPFAGIPRCITISYSTLSAFGLENITGVNLFSFSLVTCLLIFAFTFRPNKILSLLGYFLTPVLLLSLAVIVIKGAFSRPEALTAMQTRWEIFSFGLVGGYHTMDLLAAFFFSSVVIVCLRKQRKNEPLEGKPFFSITLLSSLIAALLLSAVYISFTYLAAGYSDSLALLSNHEILGALTYKLLGPYAGMVAGVAITFACLTTEIALAAIFADFLNKNIFREKISYPVSLGLTLLTALLVSTLRFEGISFFVSPILQVCYPALIVLTIANILYKLYGFKPVKMLFYGTFLGSLVYYYIL